jgi:LAO/AO transport system kinase
MNGSLLAEQVMTGSRVALAKAITLIESSNPQHRQSALALLKGLKPQEGSLRLGICGSPGAGKSTLIEALGLQLVEKGEKLAVLAIDPSSPTHGGSILGDKTRMASLATNPLAYIRPSPTMGALGGVTVSCSESITLCENAGFHNVIIETVGLGQNETTVDEVTDLVLFVTTPAGGDSLQGIKKGIMEVADLIVVNKADGPFREKAKACKFELEQAVKLNLSRYLKFKPEVLLCSAVMKDGISELWQAVLRTRERLKEDIFWKRKRQVRQNTLRMLEAMMKVKVREMTGTERFEQVVNGRWPRANAQELFEIILSKDR